QCEPLLINGEADHAHMVVRLCPIVSLVEIVQKVKANSSKWSHEHRVLQSSFAWQRGYALSVSVNRILKELFSTWQIRRRIIVVRRFKMSCAHFCDDMELITTNDICGINCRRYAAFRV